MAMAVGLNKAGVLIKGYFQLSGKMLLLSFGDVTASSQPTARDVQQETNSSLP